ncbi:MAG: glutathione S-transferase N-terminal domain-containing protein [Betaproteobacteria bacterium]|nr:glutathione S-transferase N-terminal domain-containing protein [Betaproteobacteria bacterium]
MLKIWGRLTSVNVQKVVWCVDELGIAYERVDAGRDFGIVGTPEYLAKNPNGLIPVIEDDGFVLWESNAIVRYLAAKYGMGTLCPTDARARADADRWMDWQTTTFNPAIAPAFWHLIRFAPDKRDDTVIENARVTAEKHLALLDAHLAAHQFVIGDTFTMGDIPLACSVNRWYKLPLAHAPHANVERWYYALCERKSSQQVVTRVVE